MILRFNGMVTTIQQIAKKKKSDCSLYALILVLLLFWLPLPKDSLIGIKQVLLLYLSFNTVFYFSFLFHCLSLLSRRKSNIHLLRDIHGNLLFFERSQGKCSRLGRVKRWPSSLSKRKAFR